MVLDDSYLIHELFQAYRIHLERLVEFCIWEMENKIGEV